MPEPSAMVIGPLERYNPLIKPTDESWAAVVDKFRRLLARPSVRVQDILDDHFTPHERNLFLPASEPPSLRDCQRDNTKRYEALLGGRFKGHVPTLASKFAMLYFGLPVEPILSEYSSLSTSGPDFDDGDDVHHVEARPPLHFLTAHDRRNFGHDSMKGQKPPGQCRS
ncbi:hypothetical protein C8035_v010842 [Colletotrichum spinosum]|uniref:Uncharacterized protein n=1 Tax=Colletotrichum spinosum TaxID=1347390 RepID=A0A4R8Q7Q2_9PEZI|nr:hypothetical protein C8035_v010842 [Colletotrichum spinosum]